MTAPLERPPAMTAPATDVDWLRRRGPGWMVVMGKEMAEGFLRLGAELFICGRRKSVCDATAFELADKTGGQRKAEVAWQARLVDSQVPGADGPGRGGGTHCPGVELEGGGELEGMATSLRDWPSTLFFER